MRNFFRMIWPTTIPARIDATDVIAVLRERILQSFLIVALWVMVAAVFLQVPVYIQAARWGYVIIFSLALISMITVTFFRELPYLLRGSVVIIVVYVIALGSLFYYGLSGNGPVLLVGFVALSVILLGSRLGIGASVIAFGSMAVVGYLMVKNTLPLPSIEIQANSSNTLEWANHTLVVTLLAVIFTISLTVMIGGLRNAITEQKQFGLGLEKERQLLEERVTERTIELERQAFELETASKIAHDISQIIELDELLTRAVDMISGEYHLYFAAIYLTESHQEYTTLRSASGEVGQKMQAMNFNIPLSDAHPVALATRKNEIRLTQDVNSEPLFVRNPLLPETRAQLVIPLVSSGRTIGVLDTQSNVRKFFKPSIIRSIHITADQLAVAIEKSITVQQLTATLNEMREINLHATREAWQGFHRSSRHNFAYHVRQGKVESGTLPSFDQSSTIGIEKTVIQKHTDPQTGFPYTTITLPIKSRDLVLGSLNLRFNTGQVTDNIVDLLQSVTTRLALAIENARLIEENQMKVARDQTVGDISAKLRAESDIDKVLRIVATELGRSLGVSDVVVQLRENVR